MCILEAKIVKVCKGYKTSCGEESHAPQVLHQFSISTLAYETRKLVTLSITVRFK